MPDTEPNTSDVSLEDSSGDVTRREVLTTVSAVGASGIAAELTSMPVEAATSDVVEIVHSYRYKDPHNPAKGKETTTKVVPRDWYSELHHARRVRDQQQFEQRTGIVSVGVAPGKYGGRSARIDVGAAHEAAQKAGTTVDDVLGSIPDEVDGVTINKKEVGMPILASCDGDKGDTIPGGAVVENEDGGYGTFAAACYEQGNGPFFLTNQHLFNNYQYPIMHDGYHPESTGDAVADLFTSNCEKDFVLADGKNGHVPTDEITGTSLSVVGQYTKAGIDDLIAADKSAEKFGVRTCHTSGKIYKSDGYIGPMDDGCGYRNHQVKGEWDVDNGDSGSVAYRDVGGGDAKVLSVNAGYDPLNDNAFGFGAYHLDNAEDVYWN